MISIGITLIVWGIIFLIVGITSTVYGVKFLFAQRELKRRMEDAARKADARLRLKYNRIATLEVNALHDYLTRMFARCLEIVSDREISTKDPDGGVALYTLAAAELIKYLGPETMEAIDYYYGENYITRWTSNAFSVLEKRGAIGLLVQNKSTKAENLIKVLE